MFTRLTDFESQEIEEENQVVIDNGYDAEDLPPPDKVHNLDLMLIIFSTNITFSLC